MNLKLFLLIRVIKMLFCDASLCNSVLATCEAMGETSSVYFHNN